MIETRTTSCFQIHPFSHSRFDFKLCIGLAPAISNFKFSMKHRHHHIKNKIKHLKPKKNIFKSAAFWIISVLVLVAILVGYLIFFFSAVQVQAILVAGNQVIPGQTIEAAAWQYVNKKILGVGNKNIFTVNIGVLKKELLADFTGVEDIKIQKNYFTSLNLQITERSPSAVFCPGTDNQQCFTIDKNGVIYEALNRMTVDSFIVRQTMDAQGLKLGQQVIDKKMMDGVVKIKENLVNNFKVGVQEAIMVNPLVIKTSEGWGI